MDDTVSTLDQLIPMRKAHTMLDQQQPLRISREKQRAKQVIYDNLRENPFNAEDCHTGDYNYSREEEIAAEHML